MTKRHPNLWLNLTTALAVDSRLTLAAKYRAAIAARLPGHDPSRRVLERALPFKAHTLIRGARELEAAGYARAVRRPGRRLILEPLGDARPGTTGRRLFAQISPELFRASLEAGSGRSAAYGPLVLSRLLRRLQTSGAAHVAPDVIAADLDVRPRLVTRLLDDLEAADVIERHRDSPLDADELRLYTVPRAHSQHPVELGRLDPAKTRVRELVTIGDRTLTVLGSPAAFGLIPLTLAELEDEVSRETIVATIDRAVADNLTGERMLVEDLLASLRAPLSSASATTYPGLGTPPTSGSDTPSREEVEEEESFRADARDEEQLDRESQKPPGNGSGEELSFDEQQAETALPRTTAAILYAFDDPKFRRLLLRDLDETLTIHLALHNETPSAKRAEILDDALAEWLSAPTSRPGDARSRFALYRAIIKRGRQADEIHAAMKAARPSPEPVIDFVGLRAADV